MRTYEPAYRYGYELGTQRALPGARLGRPGSGRPPRLGSTASEHLGALQRRHPLWLGQSPRPDLGQRTTAPGRAERCPRRRTHSQKEFPHSNGFSGRAQEASAVETSSRLDFLLLYNCGTRFGAP